MKTLRLWYPTYIQEIEHQRGWHRGDIPSPRTYTERWQFTSYPDDQIPLVVVVSPGMAEAPVRDGEGVYSGWWIIGVGIVAAAATEDNSERLAKVYGAAARGILTQKAYLDDSWEFSGCEVMDESYDEVPDMEQARTMRSVQIVCRMYVENMYNRYGGPQHPIPPDPDSQPGSQWPEVEEAFTEVIKVEEV